MYSQTVCSVSYTHLCKGAFHCFPLFPLLGFTGIGQAVGNRFSVHQGSSGTFPDFPQHMTVKGVIINPVLGAVVLSKGIVGPVSYTHLDVYKRQHHAVPFGKGSRRLP